MPETQLFHASHRRTAALTVVAGLTLGLFASAGLVTAAPASAATASRAAVAESATLVSSVAAADTAADAARAALSSAASTVLNVDSSGLDVGAESTAIDTADLVSALGSLTSTKSVTVLNRDELAAEVVAQTETVTAATAALQSRLDAAVAAKEAAEAAAAAAAAAALANTPDGARTTARQIAADQYGWGDDQFSCLNSLWNKESGWNYQAYNSGGGATGIPQALPGNKMASFGADWQTNATTQIKWGLDYIQRAYGSPCSAWGHSQSVNWY